MTGFSDQRQAFAGLANAYDQARSSYPEKVFLTIIDYWHLSNDQLNNNNYPTVADIGCGTGIATRGFYQTLQGQVDMIGIEPGKDMLAKAIATSPSEIRYLEGNAEQIPLADHSVDIITAAQAAQWFNRPLFYQQVKRLLKIKGVIAIFENNRDWENSEFLKQHEAFLETYAIDSKSGKKYSRYYRNFSYQDELSQYFTEVKSLVFSWQRLMTPEIFLSMAKSSTQVKKACVNIGDNKVNQLILENANRYVGEDKQLSVAYQTKLYLAKTTHA